MQLFKKQKTFCCNFIAFLESTLNIKCFEEKKKHDPHSLSISQIIDSKKLAYLNA